jgi:hypothetical protein
MYVRVMQAGAGEAVAALRAAYDAFAACDLTALTRTELLGVLDDYEALLCQLPSPLHRLLAQLQADTTPQEMGAKSWNTVRCASDGACPLPRPAAASVKPPSWGRDAP